MTDSFDVDAIRASVDLARLVAQHGYEVKHQGGKTYRYKALCPFHTEKTPSFTISEYHGRQRYKCYGCGEEGDVFSFYAAMHNLDLVKDFPKICKALSNGAAGGPQILNAPLKKPPPRITSQPPATLEPNLMLRSGKEPVSHHPYLTATSDLLGYAAWYEGEDEPRYWTWGRRTPEDIARWEPLPFSVPRPLYGLEQLARKPDTQVVIVEDERTADAAQELFPALACISWPEGLEGIGDADWTSIAGRQVVLIPRNDRAGEQIMERLAAILYERGIKGIRGVGVDMIPQSELPGSPEIPTPDGWDLRHALESGWTPETALSWAQRHAQKYPVPAPEVSEAGAVLPPPPAPPPEAGTHAGPHAATQQRPPESPTSAAVEEALASIASAPGKSPGGMFGEPKPKKKRSSTYNPPAKQSETLEVEPEVDLPPEFTESGLAVRFVAECGEDWRYTALGEGGRWYRWTGERWEEDVKRSRTWIMQKFCAKAQAQDHDLTRSQRDRICTARMIHAVLSLVATHPDISVSAGLWNSDPLLLGVPGGAWDFRTGKLIPGTREQYITRCTSVAPEFERAELWEKHVLMMCGGDRDKANFLQQWAGYCATGETREQCFTFLYGLGQNGKGVFALTLMNVLGYRDEYGNPVESMSYAGVAEADAFMATEAQRHTHEIAVLRNMRLVIVDETDAAKRWNEERVKKITGGAPLTAHRMQKDNESFAPQFKLLVCGNHKPALRGVGKAILRRINMVHCPYEIPDADRDNHIEEKLALEYPRILGWILRGAELWLAGGLPHPEVIQADTQAYVQAEDVIGDWIEAMCKISGELETGDGYKNYCEWCRSEGHKEWSRRAWNNALSDRGYGLKKSGGIRYLQGISLRTAADAREDHGIEKSNKSASGAGLAF